MAKTKKPARVARRLDAPVGPTEYMWMNRVILVALTWPAVWITGRGQWTTDIETQVDGIACAWLMLAAGWIIVRSVWLFFLETLGLITDRPNNKHETEAAPGHR